MALFAVKYPFPCLNMFSKLFFGPLHVAQTERSKRQGLTVNCDLELDIEDLIDFNIVESNRITVLLVVELRDR
jgi:hypothetical protein